MTIDYNNQLSDRKIRDVAISAGWELITNHNRPAWAIPVWQRVVGGGYKPHSRFRIRYADKKQIAWSNGDEDVPKYYFHPDMKKIFDERGDGVLYLGTGEIDSLSLHAVGLPSISFFGEGNIPDTFIDDMQKIGVKKIFYVPDHDEAGYKAAKKIFDKVYGHIEIDIRTFKHVNGVTRGYDYNDFYIQSSSNMAFGLGLLDLPKLHISSQSGYDLEKIKDGVDLVKVAEHVLSVDDDKKPRKNGTEFCFHANTRSDSDGSVWVGPITWYDFGASEGGSVFDFLFTYAGVQTDDFKGAIEWLINNGFMREHEYTNNNKPTLVLPKRVTLPEKQRDTTSIVSLKDRAERFVNEATGKVEPDIYTYKCPIPGIVRLGGFARNWYAGNVIAVIGGTGTGKTTFTEDVIAGELIRRGESVLMVSPEWGANRFAERMIAKLTGGMLVADMDISTIDRILDNKRQRPDWSAEDIAIIKKARDEMMAWPGDIFFADKSIMELDYLLHDIKITLDAQKAKGSPIRVIIFDYVQKLTASDKRGWDKYDQIVNQIEEFCRQESVTAVIVSQVKKGADDTQAQGEGRLTRGQALGMSLNPFKFVVILNAVFDDNGAVETVFVDVVKNSTGKTGRGITVNPDFPNFDFGFTRSMVDVVIDKRF